MKGKAIFNSVFCLIFLTLGLLLVNSYTDWLIKLTGADFWTEIDVGLGVVSFILSLGFFLDLIDALIAIKRAKCQYCKQRMRGAGYEIEELSEDTDDRHSVATVQITTTCPFCGENNYFTKKVTTAMIDQNGRVHRKNPIASLNKYCKKLYRS